MSEIKHPTFTITLENGGEMKGELYPEIAPQSVGNFVALANSGFYDSLLHDSGRLPQGQRHRRPGLHH